MGAIGKQSLGSLPATLDEKLSQGLMLGIRRPVEEIPIPRIYAQVDLLLALCHGV